MTKTGPEVTAMALISTARQIDPAVGQTTATPMAEMIHEVLQEGPAFAAQVMSTLAAYGATVLEMCAETAETSPDIIHQEMALAIAENQETAS